MRSTLPRSLSLLCLSIGSLGGCASEAHDESGASEAAVVGHDDRWCRDEKNFDETCAPTSPDSVWISQVFAVDTKLQEIYRQNVGQKLCFGEAIYLDSRGQRVTDRALWLQGKFIQGCFTTKTFRRNDVVLVSQGEQDDLGQDRLILDRTTTVVGYSTWWTGSATPTLGGLCWPSKFECNATIEGGKLKIQTRAPSPQ